MDVDLLDIVTDKFRHNIKRSIFIKEMKQYDLEEFKIKKKDSNYEVYVKKSNSKKKLKKIYEFKTYSKSNVDIKKRKRVDQDLEKSNKNFKKMKLS
jgi:hypothetical protein